jgi:hypothetical protein
MCPLCITTVALSAAGATSGAGVIALAASKWRGLRRWACNGWRRSGGRGRRSGGLRPNSSRLEDRAR